MTIEPAAILVLGGRVLSNGRASGALARRIAVGADAARRWPEAAVVACGGRAWDGVVEADVIARELVAAGIDGARIERERLSLTTRENLIEARVRLLARGVRGPVAVVTCGWHLPRALSIASRLGVEAIGVPAEGPPPRWYRRVRERLFSGIDRLLFLAVATCAATLLVACSSCRRSNGGSPGDAAAFGSALASASASAPSASQLVAARVAADRRVAAEVAASLSASPDPIARRAAARALAQIGGEAALLRLGRALSDEDPEVVAWAA
ncbi:MAG: YdcF family protein, partial [Polyangiales bacterium]